MRQSKLDDLSFAARRGGVLDLWTQPTDNNDAGRLRAAELVDYMRAKQAPMVLAHVVQHIMAKGVFGAAEDGFFHGVAMAAIAEPAADQADAERPAGTLKLRLCGGTDVA